MLFFDNHLPNIAFQRSIKKWVYIRKTIAYKMTLMIVNIRQIKTGLFIKS